MKRWLRFLAILAIGSVVAVFVGGEIYMRWVVGMGDPPLFMTDPAMHFRYCPSQTAHRLHSLMHFNAYSMRSDDFPPHKSSDSELRIVMIGDSVINGGARVDQKDVVSAVLQTQLANDLARPVVVANASTGGWGPPMELGWIKTFGTLDADIVILVISSHDYADVPHWPLAMGADAGRPTRKPLFAWEEFLRQYVSRVQWNPPLEYFTEPTFPKQSEINWCSWAIQQIIQIAHHGGAKVIVALFPEKAELVGDWMPGHDINKASAKAGGADMIWEFAPTLVEERVGLGRDPYRLKDPIHPNTDGHRVMAEDLTKAVKMMLAGKSPDPTASTGK